MKNTAGTQKNRTRRMLIIGIGLLLGMHPGSVAKAGPVKAKYQGKKILYINSYHTGYAWSDGIAHSIKKTLENTGVELKKFEMDSKRNPSEEFKKDAALKAKAIIEEFRPDVVIASDDNASKYLIVPYYKDKDLPFVFCGVNWDASDYGFPYRNVTGMIEVQLIDQIIETLRKYAKGDRIGFIKGDDLSARKESRFFEQRFDIKMNKRFVMNFKEWKREYLQLQEEAHIILVGNAASISGWNKEEAKSFVEKFTTVPTGNWDEWMKDYALVTFATVPSEQGEWAARTALEILDGKSLQEIPIVANKKAKILRNMRLAKKLNVVFPMKFIRRSKSTTWNK